MADRGRLGAAAAGLAVACAWWIAAPGGAPDVAAQSVYQRRILDYPVIIQLSTNASELAPATDDQITVIFSNRSADATSPPLPLFGEDILEEFSVSGMEVAATPTRFSRRVRDKSFVDARFIRVVNHGSDGWAGDRIWLVVDGETILNGVRMAPRRGSQPSRGFQHFNPKRWRERVFWEAELQPFRRAARQSPPLVE
jgi:hypothetical protein